jgi:transposase-like protein
MTERKVYRPEEKMKIVMEGISGTISVSDLCRKYEIKPARFYYWKDQLISSASHIFENRGRKIDEDRIRAEKDREIAGLKAAIAKVVQKNLEIKKKIGERLQRRGQTWDRSSKKSTEQQKGAPDT